MSLVLPVRITRSEPLVCRESLRSATASNNPSSCSLDQPTYRKTNKKSSWISFLQCWQSHIMAPEYLFQGKGIVQQHRSLSRQDIAYPLQKSFSIYSMYVELCDNIEAYHKALPTTHCRNPTPFSQFLGIVQQHWRLSQDIAYCSLQKSFYSFSISWNCARKLKLVTWHRLPIAEILPHFLNFLKFCKEYWRLSQDITYYYPLQKSFSTFSISWPPLPFLL